MFKINNNISIDLTPHVDIDSLLALKPYIDYAIVKNLDGQTPAQYAGELFFENGTGFIDVSFETRVELLNKYPFIGTLNYKELLLWMRYHMDIKYGQSHLHVIKPREWTTKHLKEECDSTPATESFKPFLDWIDNQNIFSSYGRVNVFLNEPHCSTPVHFDPPTNKVTAKDQFIWITLDDRKRFFVYDPTLEIKHYLSGYVGVFDNYNYHGAEASEYASWSIRIDGLFSEEFLDKSNMKEHFK